ncbi:MAG: hypothetical protein JSW62_04295 [Thermoplasmatales archaeon]|nr:MAG: hypothetical protein JSW62_04295 [Thermoplasmatales archaeon]
MNEKNKVELTEGSEYKIYSLGGKDRFLETEGVFYGFISIGVDETGLLIKLNNSHGTMAGKTRIVPLHAILAIDVLKAEENEKKDDDKQMSHYVG